jgi:methyl-accepting chemotaxis protein
VKSKRASTAERARSSRAQAAAANGDTAMTQKDVERLLAALRAAKNGDFSIRLSAATDSGMGEVAVAFNELAERHENFALELQGVNRVIEREGRMTERASLPGASGSWAEATEAVNGMIDNLARPTTEVARVIDAVADGDLSQKMALKIEGRPVKGEFARIGTTVNQMVDQLSSFADEVTRVAKEVGTEGKLGGQAQVKGVSGVWKDLTENVNSAKGKGSTFFVEIPVAPGARRRGSRRSSPRAAGTRA